MNEEAQARAAIEALLHQPDHDLDKARGQSKDDSLDDPGHNNPHAVQDPQWKQRPDGSWSHPDFD